MKKVLILCASLVIFGLLFWGCSDNQAPTSSDSTDNNTLVAKIGTMDVLIGFSGSIPEAAIKAAGGAIKKQYSHVPVVFASVPTQAIEGLRHNPNVIYVEEDIYKDFFAQTLDWGVDRIDAEYVHANSSYDGSGVNIAVLDSGGDMDHEDLTWAGGYSATNNNPTNWDDKNGHGTHCAGIISADNNSVGVVGVAPNCNIYAVQVGSRRLLVSDIIQGIDWVIGTHSDGDPNNDIQIMSMSFGGGYHSAEEAALLEAYNLGILQIAATGNKSTSVSYPAKYSFIMAITASTSSDGFGTYSNTGSEVELIAPGSSVYSTYKGGGYNTLTGTSMACPMVAGTAALAWSAHPGYSRNQIKNLLKNSAQDLGLSSDQQGSGLVDAENATLGTTNGNDFGGPEGADTMHVESITFSNSKKFLYTYVTIHDESHTNPVSGAYVTLTLHHVGGNDYDFGGTTDADGQVKFSLRGISSGLCFEATVTNVTKSGWSYNSGSNHETTDSYCIP